MSVYLGCIADDFTGATDLAGILARSGMKVSMRIGIPDEDPLETCTSTFEVIALKCRTAPVSDAVEDACKALSWLQRAGAQRFFWKYCSTFDSTAQGNIGPIAEALMNDLGTLQTIYCPAFPENDRSVYMGNIFVGQDLLSESSMKDHPLTPMHDSNLVRLLSRQVTGPVGLADHSTVSKGNGALLEKLGEFSIAGVKHVVVDAINNEDLKVISETCRDMPLITGGSAVAMALPNLYLNDDDISFEEGTIQSPPLSKGSIVLSGSCSAMSLLQVADYSKHASAYCLDPLQLMNDGTKAVRTWLSEQSAEAPKLIYSTMEPDKVREAQSTLGVENAGALIEETLAQLALDACRQGVSRFVVAGGETSGAVTQALGVKAVTIGKEIAPGVPWAFSKSNGKDIALALKSGNFGAPNFFSEALLRLDEA